MKKYIIVIIAVLYSFLGVNMLFAAADTWTQKADFGGTARDECRRLLHREQGLHRDGSTMVHIQKDFWEYDPAANTWTQKADFGGAARDGAVGFSIGSKGYIGTGWRWFIILQRLLGVRPCRQYLDTEGRFRGDSARWCRRLLHREQGLHRDGIRWFIIQIKETSGSTTLPPIPGHRRPISGGQREMVPSASPSGARAT